MATDLLALSLHDIVSSKPWFIVLGLLCVLLLVMYVKYRKAMKP